MSTTLARRIPAAWNDSPEVAMVAAAGAAQFPGSGHAAEPGAVSSAAGQRGGSSAVAGPVPASEFPAPTNPPGVASGVLDGMEAPALAGLALEVRKAASADSLLFNYILNNGKVREKSLASLRKILGTAVELGHQSWAAELRGMCFRKDVLHFGCGATLHGPVFRALGAASYAGMDRGLEPARKKLRSRQEKRTVDVSFSLVDVMSIIPGITYMRGEEVIFEDAFDVILMQSVTQKLPDLEQSFAAFARALRPRGEIWFLHENFFAWGGHQAAPRSPARYDPEDPAQAALADWGHLKFQPATEDHPVSRLNRVTPAQLRRTVDKYFEVQHWQAVSDGAAVSERITDELRRQLPELGLSHADLLTRQIVCRAVRRERRS